MQVLSLPLRIYYYLNHTWPFGQPLCMLCFYLKYVNMYASVYFLVCVSVRRCELIMHPLRYRSSRRRGDVCVCAVGWLLVCLGCLPFPLLRNTSPPRITNDTQPQSGRNDCIPTSCETGSQDANACFAELPMQELSPAAGWALMVTAELFGFIVPLALVLTSAGLTAGRLREHRGGEEGAGLGAQDHGEKKRALRMVLSCAGVFLICFVPYHITMPLDFLAKAGGLGNCKVREMVLTWHPVTLCLASLNSGLDPVMYYFTTDEFRRRFSRPELPESLSLAPRLSFTSGSKDVPLTP
ncbi:probable G-protein coupled receptor 174 isoform X2 [Esox lucius]|nr:probable G-protein coupled receptor 174 isoform X2 [Esox lucius]